MSSNKEGSRTALERLNDSIVDDILNASDGEILEEFRQLGGNPEANAAAMTNLFQRAVLTANKSRLTAARDAMRSRAAQPVTRLNVDASEARRLLREFIERCQNRTDITMAARKESELSDADVIEAIEELHRLGALPGDVGKKDD